MRGLYVYVIMITPRAMTKLLSKQDLVNIHVRNIQY